MIESSEDASVWVRKQQVVLGTVRLKRARSWDGGILTADTFRVHTMCLPGSVLSHLFNPHNHPHFLGSNILFNNYRNGCIGKLFDSSKGTQFKG